MKHDYLPFLEYGFNVFQIWKGLLPRQQISTSELVRSETYDLKEIYNVGQLVRCRVFKYDRQRKQVKLSLIMKDKPESTSDANDINATPAETSEMLVDYEDEYEIGDLIEYATIVQVNEENEYFRLKLPKGLKNGNSL